MLCRTLILALAFWVSAARAAAPASPPETFKLLVTDEAGTPVRAAVARWRAGGQILGRATSDANGEVAISFQRPKRDPWRLEIQVLAAGFAPTTATVVSGAFGTNAQLQVLNIFLPRKVLVSGIVLDAAGKPVPRATVDVFGSTIRVPLADGMAGVVSYTEDSSTTCLTGNDGRWSMETVPANIMTLTITVTDPAGQDFEFAGLRATSPNQPGAVTLASLFDGTAVFRLVAPARNVPTLKSPSR